jgi:hypothetical protein
MMNSFRGYSRTITISVKVKKRVNAYPLGKGRERTSWVADDTRNPTSCKEGQKHKQESFRLETGFSHTHASRKSKFPRR